MTYRKPAMDINKHVADILLRMMDEHGSDWTKPWVENASGHHNAKSKRKYSGMNVFILSVRMSDEGWDHPCWGTYKMWTDLGCQVKPKSKSTIITQPRVVKFEKDGEERTFTKFVGLPVFNIAQVDGDFEMPKPEELEGFEDHLDAEAVIKATKADIKHGGDRAYYSPTEDRIQLPEKKTFLNTEGYYGTALHELVHWTGHENRLSRDFSGRFGSESYAFEELVAEAGAAMLCVRTGVTDEPRADHAKYLNSWKKVLKSQPKAAVDAFKLASKASNWIAEGCPTD